MRRAGTALVAAGLVALAAGCAEPVPGAAVAGDAVRITTTTAPADPDSPQARWMNRFCGVGKLLIAAGETNQPPSGTGDAEELRRQFIDTAGRVVGVLDTVLSDLRALLPSPAPEVDPVLTTLVDNFSDARSTIAGARDDVQAADPLTVEVYRVAVDRFGSGMRGFDNALRTIGELELPDELLEAGEAAPNCAGPPPTTTR